MKVTIHKRYYKQSRRGRNPIHFVANQPKGIGTNVVAVIRIDPVLKEHKDLQNAMIGHEKYEITDWAKGCTKAHSHAKRREPKLTRQIGGVKGFWNLIERRQKDGSKKKG
jgi:hypothetical protein